MTVQLSRNTSLPASISSEIWAKTLESSAVLRLASPMAVDGNGTVIQTITGEPEANWVGETESAAVSTHEAALKTVQLYKLVVIEPFSREIIQDQNALYSECVTRLPFAIGKKFDSTVLGTTAPGDNFDVLGDATVYSASANTNLYGAIAAAMKGIATAEYDMAGLATSPLGKAELLTAVDGNQRPIFVPDTTSGGIGSVFGATVTTAKGLAGKVGTNAVYGICGDFSQARYGYVQGVEMEVSTDATLTIDGKQVSMFQSGMVAVKFTARIAFAVKDKTAFGIITA